MEEFFAKVEFRDNGCWIWRGKTWANGRYGVVTKLPKPNKSVSAHRMAYQMFNGDPVGMQVCHRCDVPLCVNPDHLFLGTSQDNMQDALKKGRLKIHLGNLIGGVKRQDGSNNGNAKLSLERVAEIRRYYAETGCGYRKLAEAFGLKSPGHARDIIIRKVWNY